MHDDGSFQVAVHQPADPNDALLKDAPALPFVPKRFVSSRRCGEILAKITQDNDEEGSVPFGVARVARWRVPDASLGRFGFRARHALYSWYGSLIVEMES